MNDISLSRRYLGLWLPFLSADCWRYKRGLIDDTRGQDRPLVFIEKVGGISRIAAVDAVALKHGLLQGISLADARARMPALRSVAVDIRSDAAFLERLADEAVAFTPSVAIEGLDGLALDITGCAHLFGGEAGLVARLKMTLRASGVSACRVAVAPTPDMAWALARFGRALPVFAHHGREARALPVAAFECDAEDARALRRAGLKTVGAVADRPSVLFTARFTSAFTTKLARVLGEEDRRITPRRPPPAYVVLHRCAEPVASSDVIESILEDLALRLAAQLQERGEGGRVFETMFFRTDGAVRRIRVETSLPTRDPTVVLRLYRDRLHALADPLDPGFGFDLIRLQVLRAEPCHAVQKSLDACDQSREQLGHLIDRLGAIFGRERIMRLQPADTHIPERSQIAVPAGEAESAATWSRPNSAPLPARPMYLFERPHPIEIIDDDRHAAPREFRWRRVAHKVMHAEGPERIADEWWGASSGFGTRDYFRVETAQSRRFWIFRGDATSVERKPAWFLHGVFP